VATSTTGDLSELELIAAQVIERRRQFAESLRICLNLSSVQWKPLRAVLALTGESRFNIYSFYPYLFREAFPPVADEVLRRLAWCGRAALDYILLYDYLLDTNRSPDPAILLGSYAFQREWLCKLQGLFSTGSPFWDYLVQYEVETAQALLDERARRQSPLSPFTMDEVRRQMVGKAALSRLAIVGLACLTDQVNGDKMQGLISSNDLYNFARQISDDLQDWRRDYANRRFSFLLSSAIVSLQIEEQIHSGEYPDANLVGKVLYPGAAKTMLGLAKSALTDAIQLAEVHGPCPIWQEHLRGLLQTVCKQQAVIREVIDRATRSSARFASLKRSAATQPLRSAVEVAVEGAVQFLVVGQEPEGCWRDFATAAGESEDWITGYVGWALCSTGKLPAEALQRAVAWLQASQFPEGGWGYRRDVVVDADSTAWCLRFLIQTDFSQRDLDKALTILLKHQHATGGFSTYSRPDHIRAWMQMEETQDLSGWCEPQLCVTAVATVTLLDSGFESDARNVLSTTGYILAHQQLNGYWHSYWWAGPHYATAHILQAMSRLDNIDAEVAALAHEWLLSSQLADGGWSYMPGRPSTPFYTALALQGLLAENSPCPSTLSAMQRGVTWLVKNQERDGSWRSSALLLLPQPQEREPWKIKEWPVSILGTGIARRDHRRFFTTATVLVALSRFLVALS